MRGFSILGATVLILAPLQGNASGGVRGIEADPLAEAASTYIAAGKTPGLAITQVHCGKERFITLGSAGDKRPVNRDTVFEIGSLSKVLTGLLLAKAVVAGRVSLQDDVRTHLPAGFSNLAWSDGEPVRLGQLVDTTSGLPDYLPDPTPITALPAQEQLGAAARLLAGYSDAMFLRDLARVKLVARPGDAPRHSNVAAQLLGHVVGKLHGGSYASVLHRQIEAPLGMRAGTEMPPSAKAAIGRDGTGANAPAFTGESIMAAGGLRYSAGDMARLIRHQLGDDAAVRLSRQARAQGPDGPIAFTWVISEGQRGLVRYRLAGSTFGFSSYMEFYPSLDYGIALLANQGGGDVQNELKAIAETAFYGLEARKCGGG